MRSRGVPVALTGGAGTASGGGAAGGTAREGGSDRGGAPAGGDCCCCASDARRKGAGDGAGGDGSEAPGGRGDRDGAPLATGGMVGRAGRAGVLGGGTPLPRTGRSKGAASEGAGPALAPGVRATAGAPGAAPPPPPLCAGARCIRGSAGGERVGGCARPLLGRIAGSMVAMRGVTVAGAVLLSETAAAAAEGTDVAAADSDMDGSRLGVAAADPGKGLACMFAGGGRITGDERSWPHGF